VADDRASALGALATEAAGRGHDVTVVAPGPGALDPDRIRWSRPVDTGSSVVLEAQLTALALKERGLRRPDVAHVVLHAGSLGVPAALASTRVPVVLELDHPVFDDLAEASPMRREVVRETLRAAARSASAVVVPRPELLAHLETHLGIRGAHLVPDFHRPAPALAAPMDPAQAKGELGLLAAQRFFALVGPLDASVALESLALAHRRVPGAGLLVAGRGPAEPAIHAMAAATRPSSPVILLEDVPEARHRAIAACDVGLTLRRDAPGIEAYMYPALRRRQVALDPPGLAGVQSWFPGQTPVVHCPPEDPDALRTALTDALERVDREGSLAEGGAATARAVLGEGDRTERLLALYAAHQPGPSGPNGI